MAPSRTQNPNTRVEARRLLDDIDQAIAAASGGDDSFEITIRMSVMGGLLGTIQRLGGPGAADFALAHLIEISMMHRNSDPQH